MNATALKHDTGKPRIDLIPPKAIIATARIFTFGAAKYGDYNWRSGGGLNHSRLFAAIMRHLLAWWDGEDNDPESGESHLAHAACSLTMLLSGCGVDDRPESPFSKQAMEQTKALLENARKYPTVSRR